MSETYNHRTMFAAETLEQRVLLSAGDFLDTGPFVSDSDVHDAAPVVQPPGGGSYVDPVFHTTIRRLTATPSPTPGHSSPGTVPEYSKVQAWNCDNSRLLLRGTNADWWLYDGSTLSGRKQVNVACGDIEPRWSKTDPNRFYYLSEDKVLAYDVRTRKSKLIVRFKGAGNLSSGAEQELPADGRYFAVHGAMRYDRNGNFVSTTAWVVDLKKRRRIGPWKKLSPPKYAPAGDSLDYVAITPDSKYVIAMWDHGTDLYTTRWKFVRRLTHWAEHADFAQYGPGQYALVIAHYRGSAEKNDPGDPENNDETIELIPLDGSRKRILWLAPVYNLGIHISARNTKLPGWVFVSTYWDGTDQRPGPTPFENEVFALSLDSTADHPIVRRLAHVYMNARYDYWDEPHATVRQDGRQILFASNFGNFPADQDYEDTYLIDLR